MEIRGAAAVVTGASSGIGRETALEFARAGASVALAARRIDRLEEAAREIESAGGRALVVGCDVTLRDEVERLAREVRDSFGRCDVLLNSAGVPGGGEFTKLSFEQVESVVRSNLLSILMCTKAFLPMMLEAGRGHVVNIASLAGRHAVPGASVYSATKHAVVAFSNSLNEELQSKGVLVTSVNPGLVRTEGFPMVGTDPRLVMEPARVARVIVDVVRKDKAPEVSIPRWAGSLETFRILTPGPYRWAVRKILRRRHRPEPAPD
ncbi:MAG: SDR family oxidoreductase [Actinomycetota bacterium]